MSQHTHWYRTTADTDSPSVDRQMTVSPPTGAGGVVLVVDDIGGRGARYKMWLGSRYDVRRTGSGDDVVAWVEHERPDAIVLDGTAWPEMADALVPELAATGVRYQTLIVTETRVPTAAGRRITDERLHSPVDRDRLVDAFERARAVTTYDAIVAELLALGTRRDMLREEVPPGSIESSPDVRQVSARIETRRDQLAAVYERLLRGTADPLLRTEYDLSPADFDGP